MALMNWADKCFGKALYWLKLSNSGDALKLMIPSYSRKAISGQSNYLDTVISHKMMETEMGNRGTKSKFNQGVRGNFVKVQRVDGSWSIEAKPHKMLLRCTLMDFKRSYQINVLSKGLNKSTFSTVSYVRQQSNTVSGDKPLNPYFLTGFTDAEGCFSISVQKTTKTKIGYRVKPIFEISLNQRDRELLNQIKAFFGNVGTIREDKSGNAVKYAVENVKDLTNVIIPFFTKYPLLTQKAVDFKLFVLILNLISKGVHLTPEGLQQIINFKASMNFGLSKLIKSEFSNINPVER